MPGRVLLHCTSDTRLTDVMWNTYIKRHLLLALGGLSMAIGIVGIFLPLLPTTPFMLLALWAFSKSSQRFHDYLWNHPRFGATARNWQQHRVVPRSAKISALLVIATSSLLLLFVLDVPRWAAISAVSFMSLSLSWLLTRPEKPAAGARGVIAPKPARD